MYGFTKRPLSMHLIELIYFTFSPIISCEESIHTYSSEMNKRLLFCSSYLGLNIIYGKMNQSSRQIFRGEGEIQVGKVALFLDFSYGSEQIYI